MRISTKATEELTCKMQELPTYSIADGIEELRGVYDINVDKLVEQALRRAVGRCSRRVVDSKGRRNAFVLANRGIIVNLNHCNDPVLLREIAAQMDRQLNGYKASRRRLRRRLKEVQGQLSMFDAKNGTTD